MTGKTHMIGGAAAALAVADFTSYDPLLLTAAGVIGALLPDICHGGSKIGRSAPVLSKLVNVLFGHRTITHSLLFLILIQAVMIQFVPYPELRVGLLAGIGSHLVLDAMTKKGIKFLYPLNFRFRFPFAIRTGGAAESGILTILSVMVFYYGLEVVM